MVLPVDPSRYAAFLAVMAVMAVTPGPANLFAIATGVEKGRGAALIGMAGMSAATLVWFAAAGLGLAAVVAAWPAVFRVLAYIGAAYLVWLGIKSARSAFAAQGKASIRLFRSTASAFRDGFSVQVANPKLALFFGTVLPPFLDPQRPLPPQLALFACATLGMDAVAMSAYGLGGAALSARMSEPAFRRAFALFTGALLITAAVLIISRA